MISNDSLLRQIRSAFNLNIYEAKVWVALLSKGVATAGELSDMSNVPRSRSYDVLESLEKRGFVIMKIGRPIKYLAVSPEDILARVKRDISEKAQQEVTSLERLEGEEVYTELGNLYHQGIEQIDPHKVAGFLKSRSSSYDQMQSLLSSATSHVYISTTDTDLVRKAKTLATSFRRMKQNGVTVHIVAPLASEQAKVCAQDLAKYATVKSSELSSRFVVVDDTHVVFMISSDDDVTESNDAGVWVQTPFFASAMGQLFKQQWDAL